jgi:hypothetical protein
MRAAGPVGNQNAPGHLDKLSIEKHVVMASLAPSIATF